MAVIAVCSMAATGCDARPVSGGTEGTLRAAGTGLGDIQVTIHQRANGAFQPIGFGVSDTEGKFQLATNGATGALRLTAGEYCCTLESAGAPVTIPAEYTQPGTTPLKFSWSENDGNLSLEIPTPLLPQ
jgi:hypothetical protein